MRHCTLEQRTKELRKIWWPTEWTSHTETCERLGPLEQGPFLIYYHLRPGQSGKHFAKGIFKLNILFLKIFFYQKCSKKIAILAQTMVCRPGTCYNVCVCVVCVCVCVCVGGGGGGGGGGCVGGGGGGGISISARYVNSSKPNDDAFIYASVNYVFIVSDNGLSRAKTPMQYHNNPRRRM